MSRYLTMTHYERCHKQSNGVLGGYFRELFRDAVSTWKIQYLMVGTEENHE
jgi:hypothetical protein